MTESELIDHGLKLSEEINRIVLNIGTDDTSSERLYHLQLLNDRIDVTDASHIVHSHLDLSPH